MNLLEKNQENEELQEVEDAEETEETEKAEETDEFELSKPRRKNRPNQSMNAILLGIIIILLVVVIVLMVLLSVGKKDSSPDSEEALQQSITDYANEQKANDITADIPAKEAVVVDSSDAARPEQETAIEQEEPAKEPENYVIESETIDKTAIVVDIEDENDVAYTKEFILNEMEPYFADNNLEAVWDLAHLKRYVKLSAELKNTNSYYYLGDIDDAGKPDGIGLAIYEKNTYYYGSWVHGMREGNGRWYRFYIDEIGSRTTKKKYQAHSYSGQWRNDLPNGDGAEHYDVDISQLEPDERVIQNVIGNFTDGLYNGELYANSVNYLGTVEEWNGTAWSGVFELWRDVSSIGECSVWQNKLDENSWIDIDESENKNQGMRELLVIKPEK